ncbi:MAG: D-alanine--D-alanine ligase [Patescibacteria group bacterium]
MKTKLKIGVIFGGKSAEHEVSLQSAKNIINSIDKKKYDTVLIGVSKKGEWFLNNNPEYSLNSTDPKLIKLNTASTNAIAFSPQSAGKITDLNNNKSKNYIDVAFPILHGPFGEDGTVQGLLKLLNVPFVGAGVLGSAVGMDKDVMKRLLRDAGIPIAKFLTCKSNTVPLFKQVAKNLGLPFFVKPANLGSSVGISKVKKSKDFKLAIDEAFKYDTKVILEECIIGRELECSILGNDDPIASIPGEVIPHHDFYSYEAKYIDEHGATLKIPANLNNKTIKKLQTLGIKTFKVLNCEGMGRVDFFLKKNGEILVNEINTIPGFTPISMYPKLWEASGISSTELIDRLIKLALEKFEKERDLKSSYSTK